MLVEPGQDDVGVPGTGPGALHHRDDLARGDQLVEQPTDTPSSVPLIATMPLTWVVVPPAMPIESPSPMAPASLLLARTACVISPVATDCADSVISSVLASASASGS